MTKVLPATIDNVAAIAALLVEMDRFYGAIDPDSAEERALDIHAQLFATPAPAATVLLAWVDGVAVGLASYSLLWPAVGQSSSLYLKELYIRQDHRGTNIGTSLMAALGKIALQNGCSRVEWTTDRSNVAAQRFYNALGTHENSDKVFYRVDDDGIRRLADLS